MQEDLFLGMLKHVRRYEEVVLHGNVISISPQEELLAGAFLLEEYNKEASAYPFQAPPFDRDAAVWASKTLYRAAQFMLYRENDLSQLTELLKPYGGKINPSAILSADLSLRFLPDILLQLELIDHEDLLITLLEALLYTWHYSGVRYHLELPKVVFDAAVFDDCLYQLYKDRIVANNKIKLALHPFFEQGIRADLGLCGEQLWPNFNSELQVNEQY